MNAFDKIIGYDSIKTELIQVCDMIRNPEIYKKMGAKLPKGILLFGDPGLGKSLMAKCFVEECGLPCFTVRRNKSSEFTEVITEAFEQAIEQAPSIVFLDDMDKFANEDENHVNAAEYVAVQSGIDDAKEKDVLVIATVNDERCLPDSLIRPGRFDRLIGVQKPIGKDAEKIIQFYLKDKPIADDVDLEDISKMLSYSSCAELECILNEASIRAAFERKSAADMSDMVDAVLRMEYNCPDNLAQKDKDELELIAIHEAGHLVAAEILQENCIGLASIRSNGRGSKGGFVHRCENLKYRTDDVMICLAGKLATELYYPDRVGSGCQSDLNRAISNLRRGICQSGTNGISMIFPFGELENSDSYAERNEAVLYAELEKCVMKTRALLIKNRDFLEKVRDELLEKETLVFSDIQRIKSECKLTKCA